MQELSKEIYQILLVLKVLYNQKDNSQSVEKIGEKYEISYGGVVYLLSREKLLNDE